jgi:type IV pilus assembly protein PilV
MPSITQQQGFTFIEVLVSTVIFAIAFLGLNALQIQGFRDNNAAYLRTQAAYIAYDLADRIRANTAMSLVDHDNDMTTPPVPPANNYANQTPAAGNCAAAACTPEQLAARDLYAVGRMADFLLPNGAVTVGVNGSGYLVTITWADPLDGLKTYALQVLPSGV